jgi:hypothetical protein
MWLKQGASLPLKATGESKHHNLKWASNLFPVKGPSIKLKGCQTTSKDWSGKARYNLDKIH